MSISIYGSRITTGRSLKDGFTTQIISEFSGHTGRPIIEGTVTCQMCDSYPPRMNPLKIRIKSLKEKEVEDVNLIVSTWFSYTVFKYLVINVTPSTTSNSYTPI